MRFRGALTTPGGFALAAILVITIALGTVEFGRMILDYNIVSNAAREGVRYASMRGATSGRTVSANDVATYVASRSSGLLSASNVTVTWLTDNAVGSLVQVQVNYSFAPIVTLLPKAGVTLSSTTQGVIVR